MTSTARSSDWLIDGNDLPIGLIDVALSMPSAKLVGDAVAVRLGPKHGPAAAVLRVARGSLSAADLRMQRRVLAELAIHQGLEDEWRELLPRVLAFDERPSTTVSVESYRPGTDLVDVLASHPDRVQELTAEALSAIAPLHRGTAKSVVVDRICVFGRWVVEPLAALTDVCRRLDPRLVPEMDRLGRLLRKALVGRRMPASWTHGNYTPTALRVDGVGGPVTGIVDWGAARPGQPALIDEYLMILTASCQVDRSDLGTVVADRLLAGGLSNRERDALRAADTRSDGNTEHYERINERVAILLTWLRHAADLWRKCETHPNHHAWWAAKVAPVLDAVAVLDGSDLSSPWTDEARVTATVARKTMPPSVKDPAPIRGNRADG